MLLDLSFVTLDRFGIVRRGPLEIVDLLPQTLPLTKPLCEVARDVRLARLGWRRARIFGMVHKAPVRSPSPGDLARKTSGSCKCHVHNRTG